MSFLLSDAGIQVPGKTGYLVPHYWQQTGTSCAAACLSMVLGLPEAECRRLAKTTRSGTYTHNLVPAVQAAGRRAHHVHLTGDLEDHLPELTIQSFSWPLILALEFKHEGRDSRGRRRKSSRHHVVVLAAGRFLDPGEGHELDPEAIGHLHQRGVGLKSYVIIE